MIRRTIQSWLFGFATLVMTASLALAQSQTTTPFSLLNNGHYQVHASRREAPGQVDVHVNYTPRHLHARGGQGGEPRGLTKGDVIVVPNGTPHWFKEVRGPCCITWSRSKREVQVQTGSGFDTL